MAENVKRRVASARMAVAFVAAGTIAGAAAWAQASPPAHDSALNAYLKLKGQVKAVQARERHFEKVVLHRYYPKVELNRTFVKIKAADARYIKIDDIGTKVVGGKGSVYTKSVIATDQGTTLADVARVAKIEAITIKQTVIRITNTGDGPLAHTSCSDGSGAQIPAGTLKPGDSIDCLPGDSAETVQLITGDASPTVATLNMSAIGTRATVQILIGL